MSLAYGLTGLYQGGYATNEVPCPFQGQGVPNNSTCAEMDGGGRNVLGGLSGATSSAHDAFFGAGSRWSNVGGYTGQWWQWLTGTVVWNDAEFGADMPTHFNEGQYNLRAFTYGYIQDQDFTAYAMNGQVADMRVNLLIGVNVTLDVLFKKESIITGTLNNMSARVRLFDDSGNLVAEWMSSEGTYVTNSTCSTICEVPAHTAIAANGQLTPNAYTSPFRTQVEGLPAGTYNYIPNALYPFQSYQGQLTVPSSGLQGYNYLPSNTTLLHVLMAGLPQQPPGGSMINGPYQGDPVFANTPWYPWDFSVEQYPAAYAQYPYANTGILGAPDYTGGWTAEVDFANWYGNNTSTFPVTNYYPPVQGLLMGESYHIIPGTTAKSGISYTEDGAQSSVLTLGHSMAPNHLGPYSQEGVWQISNAHLSGEASGIFEVDLNGLVSGNALAFTWANEFRPVSWYSVSVVGASGASFNFYTYDGVYEAYLPQGTYKFTIAGPGVTAQTFSVVVSPGQFGVGQNVYLQQSNIPVPEFSAIGVIAFSALAASLYILRRRRR